MQQMLNIWKLYVQLKYKYIYTYLVLYRQFPQLKQKRILCIIISPRTSHWSPALSFAQIVLIGVLYLYFQLQRAVLAIKDQYNHRFGVFFQSERYCSNDHRFDETYLYLYDLLKDQNQNDSIMKNSNKDKFRLNKNLYKCMTFVAFLICLRQSSFIINMKSRSLHRKCEGNFVSVYVHLIEFYHLQENRFVTEIQIHQKVFY